MYKAIKTVYFPPGNKRGSRIKASDDDGNQITFHYDDTLSSDGNHKAACDALKAKFKWKGDMVCGQFGGARYWVYLGSSLRT